MKTLSRDEFEKMAVAVIKSIEENVELSPQQFDTVVDVTTSTLAKSLQAMGYDLPFIQQRRN
jgi:DNA-binding transcriptional regulator YiaG